MQDDDKTVIGPGVGGGDRTLIIPTPGRNQRQAPRRREQEPRLRSPSRHGQAGLAPRVPIDNSESDNLTGLNKTTAAASTLLALLSELRNLTRHNDVNGLRNQLIHELRLYDSHLREIDTPNEIIVSARYCLCTALDEAILNTPWGTESGWAQHSMLSTFHNETFGGEKFFMILSRLLEAPARYINALELLYLILAQGFSGKYRLDRRGHLQLEQIKDNLYQSIARVRGEFERDLSPRWRGVELEEKHVSDYIPLWVYMSVFLFILVATYAGFRLWQNQTTEPVATRLEQIASLATEHSAIPSLRENEADTSLRD
ncbi:MAG: hypothetical protein CSA52_03045 [Gammaproteobacteria bacterium]|nr:MAG: hypothetical protein CSB48_03780 [Pseudomonadota bacterium]PIE38174.1 MAG: hypothetical protein CSA52_03045 [Gammaproteobacteria bacterium]